MTRLLPFLLIALAGCDGPSTDAGNKDTDTDPADTDTDAVAWECAIPAGETPDFANILGCQADYDVLSSEPADASIPGATSVKTVIDRVDGNKLYFQNSNKYCIHWEFASEHLSGGGLPPVAALDQFNSTEYYSPDRRFILGAISYYTGPAKWVYEISPYDTADAAMIETAYDILRENTWMGEELYFHPSSVAVEAVAADLPADVLQVSSDELYDGIDYQPLNPGTSTGILRFKTAEEVDGTYTPYRDLVVLDAVPNDISIVAGIITAEFQTPLAHINVLSVNRGTPNMGLRDATNNPELRALEGKWVELTVGPFEWSVREITETEADAWWEANKPEPLVVPEMDLTVTDLRDTIDMLDLETMELGEAISAAIPAFGAKGTNYGALVEAAAQGEPIKIQPGFGVPMYYYDQFMTDNGFWLRIQELMEDPQWDEDPEFRIAALEDFKDEIRDGTMRPEVVQLIKDKVIEVIPNENARFRSSTNSEDLGTFTGAGLYGSETGDPDIEDGERDSIEWAVKKVWSQVWNPRAYEEREFYSIDHFDVGIAMLVHANFPEEEANGVAITNNPYDTTGLEPAFYVNGQIDGNDVVLPEDGVLPDSWLHYYYSPGQPIVYISHSTMIAEGETVLTSAEAYELAVSLDAVHRFFQDAYNDGSWYAMDVEWKFDDKDTPGTPEAYIKQARPYPGWSSGTAGACGGGE